VTTYTIWGNMMVAVVAPIYFSFIGLQQDMPFMESFWMILKRISPVIVFPFFLALIMQHTMPKVNAFLNKYKGISFYLWACAFLLVMGKTFEFIAIHGKGNEKNIVVLGLVSILFCGIQFAVGKWLGSKYGDRVAGGQLLGQKNTAFGIWMANCYLNPLASVYVAFYAIWQNLFNSWQLWRHDRRLRLKA
jgi:BASS family bile acid:Na+ symporter